MDSNQKYIFCIANNNMVRFACDNYYGLIIYIRKHAISELPIFKVLLNSWGEMEDNVQIISEDAYEDAYNQFTHYKDDNFNVLRH